MFLSSPSRTRVAAFLTLPFVAAVLYPAPAWSQQEVDSAAASLAITPVTVIDVRDGEALPDRTVVVEGERITAAGPTESVEIPSGARVVDGTGKYLIPGLWDMHTHLLWSTDATEHMYTEMPGDVDAWTLWERYYGPTLDLLVANGVTGIREMWGNLDIVRRVRREAEAGERLAPRMSVAGHVVDGPPARWPGLVIVLTPAEARDAVDSLFAAGAEFIKVRNRVRPDAYHAVLERAQELGLAVVGHVPWLVPAAEASDAGQASIEHVTGVVEGCSVAGDELIDLNRRILAAVGAGDRTGVDSLEDRMFTRMLSTQDPGRCRALLRRLARNDTWLVPTLVNQLGLRGQVSGVSDSHEALLRYIHPGWLDSWTPEHSPYGEKTDQGYAQRQRLHERMAEITGMAVEEGVPIMSGSDTPNAYIFPGFALHEELERLVDAGLTPLQALQAATINPARFLNATDSLGTVEAGKLADLVLLDANPLEDISHTQEITAVVLDGRYLDRVALDELLEQAERAANPPDAVRDSVSFEERSPVGEAQDAEVPRTRTFSGLVAPAFPYAQPESVGISRETLDRLGDEIAEWTSGGWHYDQDLVGAELLVIKDGKAIFHEAYGWSDREASVPVERNSIWSIKSMSKPVTATAALILADERTLSLDDPVSRYVPTFPDDSTTIRHLLAQTSGYAGGADPYLDRPSLRAAVEDWAAGGPSEPWGEFHYSDFNFSALGYIVRAVSGTLIDRFTEERIIEPLGLDDTSTGFSDDPSWRARLNPWYRWNEDAGQYDLRWATNREPWPFYPAAWGMFSTAIDYAKFMALWMNGGEWQEERLLSKATVEEALRPHGATDGKGVYGYGWFVDDLSPEDGRTFSHGGGDGTLALAFPADSLIVVYMTHSRGGHHVRALINRIYMSDLVIHPGLDPGYFPLVWVDEADVDTADLTAEQRSRFIGTYRTEEGPETVARVWEEDGRLHLRYGPRGVKPALRYDLVPVGEGRFALGHYENGGLVSVTDSPPYRVQFVMENGAVQALELRRGDEVMFHALQAAGE